MVAQRAEQYFTPDEYLRLERAAVDRHEYLRGQIIAIASSSLQHSMLGSNTMGLLGDRLRGTGCAVLTCNMRLKSEATGLYTYADGVVICGKPRLEDDDNLLNPKLVVEVLSESTEDYDRGSKFDHYRSIPSFTDYIIISQFEYELTHHFIGSSGEWRDRTYIDLGDEIPIQSLGIKLAMADIYENVELAKRKRGRRRGSNGLH